MLSLAFLLLPFLPVHDFALANFEIVQEGESLSLQVKLDKENLEDLYQKIEGETFDPNIDILFVQKYLNQHFYLVVDGQRINFELKSISNNTEYYHLGFESSNKVEKGIEIIQLKNTFFLEEIDDQTNVVHFQINERLRSFKLNEERSRIEVEY